MRAPTDALAEAAAPDPESDLEPTRPEETGTEGTSAEDAVTEPESDTLAILGTRIERGTRRRLLLRTTESFMGALVETPVLVAAGREEGPTLCVVAGIHGDEINGVEIVRRLMLDLEVESLRGTVIAVPIANMAAFRRGSRYLPDRRDLNRFFPGRPFGSSASRIAHGLFTQVVEHCDALFDLHTGSFLRTNLHQLRADLSHPETAALAHDYGAEIIVNHPGRAGTLRRAATDAGIPAVTVEAGQPSRFDRTEVEEALRGLSRLLVAREMLARETGDGAGESPESAPGSRVAYLQTSWVRSDQGGILVSRVGLGDDVEAGEILGTISDPLSGEIESIPAPRSGRVIGMAFDQLVMPGFAAYHIALEPRAAGELPETLARSAEEIRGETGSQEPEGSEPDDFELEERPE